LGFALRVKVTVIDVALFVVTAQVPVPVQAPDRPVKVDHANRLQNLLEPGNCLPDARHEYSASIPRKQPV
jgi:hypothetical protein